MQQIILTEATINEHVRVHEPMSIVDTYGIRKVVEVAPNGYEYDVNLKFASVNGKIKEADLFRKINELFASAITV